MPSKHNFILTDRLRVTWFAWLIGTIAFMILSSLRILPAGSVKLLPFILAPLFGLLALLGYVSGEAPAKFGKIERSRNPFGFWMLISFQSLCAIVLVVIGVVKKWP